MYSSPSVYARGRRHDLGCTYTGDSARSRDVAPHVHGWRQEGDYVSVRGRKHTKRSRRSFQKSVDRSASLSHTHAQADLHDDASSPWCPYRGRARERGKRVECPVTSTCCGLRDIVVQMTNADGRQLVLCSQRASRSSFVSSNPMRSRTTLRIHLTLQPIRTLSH